MGGIVSSLETTSESDGGVEDLQYEPSGSW